MRILDDGEDFNDDSLDAPECPQCGFTHTEIRTYPRPGAWQGNGVAECPECHARFEFNLAPPQCPACGSENTRFCTWLDSNGRHRGWFERQRLPGEPIPRRGECLDCGQGFSLEVTDE
jgi:transcription elongation factor Elf1